MGRSEKTLMDSIQLYATTKGARLFRNNSGLGWAGKPIRVAEETKIILRPGDVLIRCARPLHAGLCVGSSDLVGFTPVKITSDMVNETLAVFTAVECKTGKLKLSKEQLAFLKAVDDMGGISVEAHSLDDVKFIF